ncbi:MAG: dihydrofolate reductase [Pirellulaceae bacterium]
MSSSIIVAMTLDRVIGRDGQLPWRLSADLQRFKRLTMGHHIIMGRKTYDSIGRLLPGRETIVVSRQPELAIPGALVVPSISAAVAGAGQDPEVFFVGGESIYRTALDVARRIYLTLVHAEIEGDAFFPEIVVGQWRVIQEEYLPADERNEYATTFRVLARKRPKP